MFTSAAIERIVVGIRPFLVIKKPLFVFDSTKQPEQNKNLSLKRKTTYLSENNPYPKQCDIGERIAKLMQEQCNDGIKNCKYLDFFILLPKFHSLKQQTVTRVNNFIDSVQQMSSFSTTSQIESGNASNDGRMIDNNDYSTFFKDIKSGMTRSQVQNHVIRLGTNAKKTENSTKNNARNKITLKMTESDKLHNLLNRIRCEDETLFLIVVDEAHWGTTLKSEFNQYFNVDDISTRKNVMILQVSATPYSLVTKNSRVPDSNKVDWFTREDNENMYYGIKDFIAATENHVPNPEEGSERLGSLCFDEELERLIDDDQLESRKLINKELGYNLKDKDTKNTVWRFSRLKIVLMQYIWSLVNRFCNIIQQQNDSSHSSILLRKEIEKILKEFSLTQKSSELFEHIIQTSDNGKIMETGKMCLLRVMYKRDGIFVYNTLRKVRKLLGMENTFALIMDCDEKEKRCYGLAEFNNTETSFLKRLQKWNGDPNFRASQYVDLSDLPILLIVVQKGKMGITFPRTLSFYDLRLRYSSKPIFPVRFEITFMFGIKFVWIDLSSKIFIHVLIVVWI